MERLNVMIVDDSSLVVKIVTAALVQLGHKVIATARTGAVAMVAYKASNPDVVLMDITMPDMDGIEATKGIVGAYPDARILIITSHADESIIANALRAGAKGYIRKPFSVEKLRGALADLIKADLAMLKS
jgi:two-component system chemotaxis response regulator CheY